MNKNLLTKELASRIQSGNFYSLLDVLPNPDIILEKAGKTTAVFQEILADDHVTAMVGQRKAGVKKLEWRIDRKNSSERLTKLVEQVFNNLDISRITSEFLNAPYYGFQVSEVIWKREGSLFIPADVKGRDNENFHFDIEGMPRFKSKNNPWKGDILPNYKLIILKHNAINENEYGERLLSKCFWPVFFKKGELRFWLQFSEKYAIPWVIGKLPRNADIKDKKELMDVLESLIQNAIATIPDDSSVELIEAAGKGSSAVIFERFVKWCEESISKVIVGQTLTSQSGSSGSYALGKVHAGVRQDLIDSDKESVESGYNRVIKWINHFNYQEPECPEFTLFQEEEVNKDQAERDETLVRMGVRFKKKYYSRKYNLEEDDFEVQEPQQEAKDTVQKQFSKKIDPPVEEEVFKDQEILNNFVDSFTPEELQKQAEAILKPVIDLVMNAKSYEEIMEKLAGLYPGMDDKQLEETLGKALTISEAWGKVNAEE